MMHSSKLQSILIILCLGILAKNLASGFSSTSEAFTCPGDGFFVDPENCQNYYLCFLGSMYLYSCDGSKGFDEVVGDCTPNGCERKTTTPAPNITCEGYGEAHPDPADCTRYYVCYYNVAYSVRCGNSLAFNESSLRCELDAYKKCVQSMMPITSAQTTRTTEKAVPTAQVATEKAVQTTQTTEKAAQTSQITEKAAQTTQTTEKAVPTSQATEKASQTTQTTQKAVPTSQVTEKAAQTTQTTEKADPTSQVTQKAAQNTQTTEKADPTSQVTQKADQTTQTTKKAAPTSQVTEKAVQTTQTTEKAVPTTQITEKAAQTTQTADKAAPTSQATESAAQTTQTTEKAAPTSQATEKAAQTTQTTEKAAPTSQAKEKATQTTQTTEKAAQTPQAKENTTQAIQTTEKATPTTQIPEKAAQTTQTTEKAVQTTETTKKVAETTQANQNAAETTMQTEKTTVTTTTVVPPPPITCPKGVLNVTDTRNCSAYFLCVFEKAFIRWCPAGTGFNPTTRMCSPDGCNYTRDAPSPTEPPYTCSVQFGIEADALSCLKYYLCFLGTPKRLDCEPNTAFNPVTKGCDADSYAPCIGTTVTTPKPTPGPGCRVVEYGTVEYNGDNQKYCNCANSTCVPLSCDAGLVFDVNTRQCAYPPTTGQPA